MEETVPKTGFRSRTSDRIIDFNYRNSTDTDIESISIHEGGYPTRAIQIKSEDTVAMAIAVLGVGRVDAHVEERARITSEQQPPLMRLATDDELIEEALVRLRAVILRRERAKVDEAKLTEDAYALYRLVKTDEAVSVEVFSEGMRDYWLNKLQSLRTL